MRRLARRLFALCSAVSLLLFVAVCVLWVRSYRVGYVFERQRAVTAPSAELASHTNLWIGIRPGTLQVEWSRSSDPVELFKEGSLPPDVMGDFTYATSLGETEYARLGLPARLFAAPSFRRYPERTDGVTGGATVIMPLWLFAAALLLPAAGVIPFLRRRARRASGLCTSCGYDLRASPERCPECGATAKPN